MMVRAGVRTDIGRARQRNEDAYLMEEPLFAVADGMGGHRGGNVASALALETIRQAEDGGRGAEQSHSLVESIRRANHRVLEQGDSDRNLRGMGTTLTALFAEAERAHLAHVGDSRAYLLRDGSLQQLTEDHTLVQRMVREGKLTPEEAAHHPQRSILTRALGVEGDVEVDELTLDLHPGDRVLLCTDGLTTMLDLDRIKEILEASEDPQAACDALVEEANSAGGEDNITAMVLEFLPEDQGRVEGSESATDSGAEAATGSRAGAGVEPAQEASDSEEGGAEPDQPSGRRRVRRAALWGTVAIVVIAAVVVGVRLYVDRQWYVGDDRGAVAIYHGIPSRALVFDLSHVSERTNLSSAQAIRLQLWKDLHKGIPANSFADAQRIVDQIREDLGGAGKTGGG